MNISAEWITGFVDGEGCFHIGINTHDEMTAGFQVLPEFTVVQHQRDVQILHALKAYFQWDNERTNTDYLMANLVRAKEHLLEKIIPFFMKHPLKSKKRQDFLKFRKVVLMMEKGEHLTDEGIERIREIAGQMNRSQLR